jgi:hypothetical protein
MNRDTASLSTAELTRGLRAALPWASDIEVTERAPASRASSFSAEVVRCRIGCYELTVFCKFGATDLREPQSHRRGLAYESLVYGSALVGHRPRNLGRFATGGTECLVLEYVDGARSLRGCGFDDYLRAMRWLGRFHQRHENLSSNGLTVYGRDTFAGWIDGLIAHRDARELPWVQDAARRLTGLLTPLLDAPLTLLHGEYFPGNILLVGDNVYPVDWETAGIGPGELDLAAVTWGWDPASCRVLVMAYDEERNQFQGDSTPAARLIAARGVVLAQLLAERRTWRTPREGRALTDLRQLLWRGST